MAVKQILRDFSGWTSAHGIPHIGSAQNWVLRVFWTLVVLTSIAMFSWQLVVLFTRYLSYGVNVQIEMTDYKSAIAGTLANGDKWKFDELGTDVFRITRRAREHVILLAEDSKATGAGLVSGPAPSANATNTSATGFDNLLYNREEFIQNCAYNTAPCNITTDFEETMDPVYGRCFTFNYKEEEPDFKSTRAGPLYGLRLLLMTNQSEYLATTESVGARVAVHGQGQEPFPDAFGLYAATGFTTSFGIKFVNTTRRDGNYGNCTRTENIAGDEVGGVPFYYTHYTVEGCFRSCFQYNIAQASDSAGCGCSDPRFSKPATGAKANCGRDDIVCLETFRNMDGDAGFNAIEKCQCVPSCEKHDYGLTVSTALWPSDVFIPADCKTKSGKLGQPGFWATEGECFEWYQKNTLLVEVYYERMNYQLLSETPNYESTYGGVKDVPGGQGGCAEASVFLYRFDNRPDNAQRPGARDQAGTAGAGAGLAGRVGAGQAGDVGPGQVGGGRCGFGGGRWGGTGGIQPSSSDYLYEHDPNPNQAPTRTRGPKQKSVHG